MHIAKSLQQSRFERQLLRLLSPLSSGEMRPVDTGGERGPEATGLALPAPAGQGRVHPLYLQPNLQALAIECQAGPAGFRFASETRRDFQLLAYARRGRGSIRVDGRSTEAIQSGPACDGRLIPVPAGAGIEWSLKPGESVRELLLFQTGYHCGAAQAADDLIIRSGERPGAIAFQQPRLALAVDRLFETIPVGGPEPVALAMLVFAWMQQAGADAQGSPETAAAGVPPAELRKIQQARAIVYQEYLNPPTTVRLARRVALNEYKLKRGYRLVYQTSIHADLRRYRMRMARDLLLAGETNVAAAACAVGYSNPGHFARAFQAEFGISPGRLTRGNRPILRGETDPHDSPIPIRYDENHTQSQ